MKAVLACAALAILAASPALAQPARPERSPGLSRLTIVAPAAPGGGWDQLAREMEREIEKQQLAAAVQVENVPGAAGTIGLAQLINTRRGDGDVLLVNGLVMLGAILWNESPVSITQTTPVARLVGEYEIVAVPAASPHRDMQSLVQALRQNPAAVSWGGGSAGGTDHILAGLIVAAADLDPRRTNYIAFSGGGEAVTALIGGQVTAGISGYSEFAQHIESGRLRAIGMSSPTRSPILDIPTLVEQGLDVELENWRAVVAPPGLSQSQREALTALVEQMAQSESWQATLMKFDWTDSFLAGPAFEQFLDAERVRIARIVSRLRGSASEAGAVQVGEWVFPVLVLGGAALVMILLVVGGPAKAGHYGSPAEAGHYVRQESPVQQVSPVKQNSGPVVRIAIGLVSFVALLNPAGFVAAGTVLFVCTASAFGSSRWLRDGLVGLTLCAAVYVTFTYALGVQLPAGAWIP